MRITGGFFVKTIIYYTNVTFQPENQLIGMEFLIIPRIMKSE